MTNIQASSRALENASAELRKCSEEWLAAAGNISSEKQRAEMENCGKIILEYSVLLEKASKEYSECESRISSMSGDLL